MNLCKTIYTSITCLFVLSTGLDATMVVYQGEDSALKSRKTSESIAEPSKSHAIVPFEGRESLEAKAQPTGGKSKDRDRKYQSLKDEKLTVDILISLLKAVRNEEITENFKDLQISLSDIWRNSEDKISLKERKRDKLKLFGKKSAKSLLSLTKTSFKISWGLTKALGKDVGPQVLRDFGPQLLEKGVSVIGTYGPVILDIILAVNDAQKKA